MNKDTKKLLKRLRAQGFRVRRGGTGHHRVTAPSGASVSVSSTPRSGSLARVRADLRRIGARL